MCPEMQLPERQKIFSLGRSRVIMTGEVMKIHIDAES